MRSTANARRREYVLRHPGAFTLKVLRAFRANHALLLSGAIAYYTLLSIIPLLILVLIALSAFVKRGALIATLDRYLSWLIPEQSTAVVNDLARFLNHSGELGWLLVAILVLSSSYAFTVVEDAMAVIFSHRLAVRRRHFLMSAILPYCFILFLGTGLLLTTLISGAMTAIGVHSPALFGHIWSLQGISGVLLYGLGVLAEIFVFTSIYLVMPVGPTSWRHAVMGAIVATVLWEITRHLLVWYFASLNQVGVVYGSLTTAIAVLASLDFAATFLLLGAQVIAEYERIEPGSGGASRQVRRDEDAFAPHGDPESGS